MLYVWSKVNEKNGHKIYEKRKTFYSRLPAKIKKNPLVHGFFVNIKNTWKKLSNLVKIHPILTRIELQTNPGWVFTHPRIAYSNTTLNETNPNYTSPKCNLPVVLLKKYGAFPPELTRVPAVESTKSSFGLIYSL
jgi:hypothetical protein